MSKSASWDMNSSSPSPGKSDYKKYTGRLQKQDSEIRQEQLDEDADFEITITGPDGASEKKTIKLFDNLLSKINPALFGDTSKASETDKKKYLKKYEFSFVDVPEFKIRRHNTLEDAVGKGVVLTKIRRHNTLEDAVLKKLEIIVTKKPTMHKKIMKTIRKSLRMKSGGCSRRKR